MVILCIFVVVLCKAFFSLHFLKLNTDISPCVLVFKLKFRNQGNILMSSEVQVDKQVCGWFVVIRYQPWRDTDTLLRVIWRRQTLVVHSTILKSKGSFSASVTKVRRSKWKMSWPNPDFSGASGKIDSRQTQRWTCPLWKYTVTHLNCSTGQSSSGSHSLQVFWTRKYQSWKTLVYAWAVVITGEQCLLLVEIQWK